jgi:hypothetical protein
VRGEWPGWGEKSILGLDDGILVFWLQQPENDPK